MGVRVGCPFCNRGVVLSAVPATGRAVCDRCGEAFAVTGDLEHVPDDLPPPPPPVAVGRRPWLVLTLIAAVGLAAGGWLLTGRTNPAPPTPPKPSGPVTWPPPAVPLLGYLPPDTGAAVVVQPGPLLAHCQRTGDDPRKLLAALGLPERAFAALDQAGLSLDRIDHLAAGLSFPRDSAIPRLVVAIRLTGPAGELFAKLKAEREAGGHYRASVGGLPLRLEERDGVYRLATDPGDLDRPPLTGSGHLPAGLRDTLSQLSPAAFAWAATDAADWPDLPAVKAAALVLKQPDLPTRLKPVRAAGVGLSLEPELRAKAVLKAAGDDGPLRDRVAAAVAGKEVLVGGGDGWVTVSAAPADFPAPWR